MKKLQLFISLIVLIVFMGAFFHLGYIIGKKDGVQEKGSWVKEVRLDTNYKFIPYKK